MRRGWGTLGLALCAVIGAGTAGAQTLWDDPAFALYRQAMDAMERKDFARADELAAQAIEKHPAHVLAHYLRGQAAAARSRWDDAAQAFGKAADLYPGSFAAQRDLAISLEHLNRLPEARAAYERALALRDEDELRTRLAFLLIQVGERSRAVEQLRALADRNTSIPEVWTALGRVRYELGALGESEKAYAKAVTLKDDGRAWFNLGVIRVRLKDTAGALDAFAHAAQHPETKQQAEAELKRLREAGAATRPAPRP